MAIRHITGTDGKVAVYDEDRLWTWWNKKEIYTGDLGLNRYVPKVGDYVEDTEGPRSVTYEVTDLDLTTLIPTLVKKRRECECGDDTEENQLVGPGPDTYRIYIDTSVRPYILAVDARLKVGGTLSDHARIFRGTDIGPTGKLISFLYDNSGNFLTNNVPLELAAIDSHTNHSIKVVSVCNTNENLRDGEYATVVIYDDNGHVVASKLVLVKNTSFIRGINSAQKYIASISLKSPYLSQTDDTVLNFPINTLIDSANVVGRLHYSDGSITEMPVDGIKFKLQGLEQFISTVPGQSFPLSLVYTLSNGEITYTATSGEGKFIPRPYSMVTVPQIGAFLIKLFCYPVWIDNSVGYSLKWFLYNMDRNTSYDVTGFVSYNTDSDTFNGKAYGLNQKLSVRINIQNVNPAYLSFIHNQKLDITLNGAGTIRSTNWTIGFEPSQTPRYGENIFARTEMITAGIHKLRVSSNIPTIDQWIQAVYRNSKPLINKGIELTPPEPNFFAVVVGSDRYEFPISSWNAELTVSQTLSINSTLFIEFIKRTNTGDQILGMSGMPIYEM